MFIVMLTFTIARQAVEVIIMNIPTFVLYFSGKLSVTKSCALAFLAACCISSRVASPFPKPMFSATVVSNRMGSWPTNPNSLRRFFKSRQRISVPPNSSQWMELCSECLHIPCLSRSSYLCQNINSPERYIMNHAVGAYNVIPCLYTAKMNE